MLLKSRDGLALLPNRRHVRLGWAAICTFLDRNSVSTNILKAHTRSVGCLQVLPICKDDIVSTYLSAIDFYTTLSWTSSEGHKPRERREQLISRSRVALEEVVAGFLASVSSRVPQNKHAQGKNTAHCHCKVLT